MARFCLELFLNQASVPIIQIYNLMLFIMPITPRTIHKSHHGNQWDHYSIDR